MAPHLDNVELDMVTRLSAEKKGPEEILAAISKRRRKMKIATPKIWAVRRAVAGVTHKRGVVEARGRKKKWNAVQTNRVFVKRRKMIEKAKGERYVTCDSITKAARVPKVHRTTAARYLAEKGVQWRSLREKPCRTEQHEEKRMDVCRIWKRRPSTFWTKEVDLIIDAKKYKVPSNAAAARRLKKQKVRGALRTRAEGLRKHFTRPSATKHKFNAGGYVHILAGICGHKVVLWEEIKGMWNADKAAEMYSGPIKDVLKKKRPGKKHWRIMEDNDPAGFKSRKGKTAKKENKMKTETQPPYSPDLNPLDFSIWAAIDRKALAGRRANETKEVYKARLRSVALGLPAAQVKKAVESIRKRAQAIFEADGGDIARD
jgi:hypothetical protein